MLINELDKLIDFHELSYCLAHEKISNKEIKNIRIFISEYKEKNTLFKLSKIQQKIFEQLIESEIINYFEI